jgi:hypothetical protein
MRWFGWFRCTPKSAVTLPEEGSLTALIAGRQRAIGVPYMLPADLAEVNRLDFQHFMLRYALRGNYTAPIEQPRQILDVGTGTRRWAVEMAQIFSQA